MKILVAGDFRPKNRVADLFEKGDFASVLSEVKAFSSEMDYSIANLECPVTKGEEKSILKYGANLQCSEKSLEALKWAGFNGVTLANNHFRDYGDEGVRNTLSFCMAYGLDIVGGGENLEKASLTLYKKIGNKTLAIINCCEHEFSIASFTNCGSNPLNPVQQYYAIRKARQQADYILVIVHGGSEMWQLPSPRMKETYRFFVDAGADAVINHHQHCYSGWEIYHGKPIVYGIGNFCYDVQKGFDGLWDYGYVAVIDIMEGEIRLDSIPYRQCQEKPTIEFLKDKKEFFANIDRLNAIIANDTLLAKETERYYQQIRRQTLSAFEPYTGFSLRLYLKGWLPSLLTKKKLLKLRNMIQCEAHRDKIEYYFTH